MTATCVSLAHRLTSFVSLVYSLETVLWARRVSSVSAYRPERREARGTHDWLRLLGTNDSHI